MPAGVDPERLVCVLQRVSAGVRVLSGHAAEAGAVLADAARDCGVVAHLAELDDLRAFVKALTSLLKEPPQPTPHDW